MSIVNPGHQHTVRIPAGVTRSLFSSLYPMFLVPVIGASGYSDDITISSIHRGLCHDIAIHKKSTIRALVWTIKAAEHMPPLTADIAPSHPRIAGAVIDSRHHQGHDNLNNDLIYIAPACRMTSEATRCLRYGARMCHLKISLTCPIPNSDKAKDLKMCPQGSSRPTTYPRGLHHWLLLLV